MSLNALSAEKKSEKMGTKSAGKVFHNVMSESQGIARRIVHQQHRRNATA